MSQRLHFPLSPLEHGWQPTKLPELATNGFPFSPTFIVPKSVPCADTVPFHAAIGSLFCCY